MTKSAKKSIVIIEIVAENFVKLVQSGRWRKQDQISADDATCVFELVSAAGFDPKKVVIGKVQSSYVEQDDPNRTQKFYNINSSCPFKVIGQDGQDDRFATGWLDCVFKKATWGKQDETIERVEHELRRSIPFKPIQLTLEGDYLGEPPNEPQRRVGDEYLIDHISDDFNIFNKKKIHVHCGGQFYIRKTTVDYCAIFCNECNLRVLIPVGIKTFGELRNYCELELYRIRDEISTRARRH